MPGGFIDVLHSYVNDYGGGMLTLGGKQDDGKTANAYNRSDMYGTTYQAMLPIEAINYTPPVAVMIIIDASGSMGESPARLPVSTPLQKGTISASWR